MSIRTLSIIWNNRVIEITYNNDWSKAHREIYGHSMAHLEIKSQDDQPLPISETGYRSHFTPTYVIEKHRGVEEFVRDWLNYEARSKAWKNYVEWSKQLTLF